MDYIFPTMTGPGFFDTDLSIYKNFTFGKSETKKLRFQFSGYNFLNHPNWTFLNGDPNLNLTFTRNSTTNNIELSDNFGHVQNKIGHRIIQMAIKFSW